MPTSGALTRLPAPREVDSLVFAHGHFLRVLDRTMARFGRHYGRYFALSTAALSILGYEHSEEEPVLLLWNDQAHLGQQP